MSSDWSLSQLCCINLSLAKTSSYCHLLMSQMQFLWLNSKTSFTLKDTYCITLLYQPLIGKNILLLVTHTSLLELLWCKLFQMHFLWKNSKNKFPHLRYRMVTLSTLLHFPLPHSTKFHPNLCIGYLNLQSSQRIHMS